MRLALLFAVVALVLAYVVYRQNAAIRDQQKTLTELRAQVAAPQTKPQTNTLEYQAKCAEQAAKIFKDSGFKPNQMAGYENHYNAKLNKCFILIQNVDAKSPGTVWTFKNLSDAYEGKSYGEYAWHTDKVKKYWEVPPFMCKVVLQSGEDRVCKSDDEFQELTKPYMED
jgi:hypothetical protein